MPLNDVKIKNAKGKERPYKLSDGEGMYLLINPDNSKYWRLKYRINKKEKVYSLGKYPEVSLSEAREERLKARKMIKSNLDPVIEKRNTKQQSATNVENTFEFIARQWIGLKKPSWTEKYTSNVIKRFEADIFPSLGGNHIKAISTPELLGVLRKIEERGAVDVAKRLCQTCGQIFRYAITIGKAERDIAADLRGALKTRKVVHHAFLEEKELPEFLAKLENYNGDILTIIAVKLLLLTFVRTAELIGAQWSEIDFEKLEWKIPPHRMKMRQTHIVPLSPQVLELLKQLREITGHSPLLFPSRNNPKKNISNNTILFALYRMGYHKRATGHGFRATASTILNEHGFRSDLIERQLAHTERDGVRASYNHAQYLSERKQMMHWWADYLDKMGGVK